jgi:hypothetical protein
MADLQTQMADDHRRDYASSTAIDALRTDIHAFLNDPAKTHRLRANTREVLREACTLLKADSDHVVAVWD